MAYVQVPKDLTKVKSKFLLNLTKRQCLCFGLGAVIGVLLYFLTKGVLGNTLAACIMIVIMLPFFLFGVYEKDGRHLEQLIKMIITAKIKRPGVRLYKTQNMYRYIQDEIRDKEVLGLDEADYKRRGVFNGFGNISKKSKECER